MQFEAGVLRDLYEGATVIPHTTDQIIDKAGVEIR